jgi:glycosyltransferase involved in cell wall biosynthesis
VVLFVDELVGRGGTETHVVSLGRALRLRQHPVEVWTLALSAPLRGMLEAAQVPVRTFSGGRSMARGLPSLLGRLRAEARRFGQGRAFVLQSYHVGADLLSALLGRLVPEAVVLSTRRDMGFTRSRGHDLALWAASGGVAQVLAVSEPVRWAVTAREAVDPRQVEVIHNGVDTARFRPAQGPEEALARQRLRASLGHGPQEVLLACVGSFQPIKGQGTLLEAMALLSPRAPSLRLLLVGGRAEYRAHHVALAERLGLGGVVQFLGERGDMEALLRACDLFALPSWSEGFSNAVLEAMASGLPVVATEVGGNLAAISPAVGALVPPGDPARLARALEPLCVDAERRRGAGQAARRAAVEVFDLERMVDHYLRAWRGALARAASR